MGLALNQDSDTEDENNNSDNENNDSNNENNDSEEEEKEEEEEEVVEDLDDDEDDNNYEGEEEFEWYDWPDKSKLATLDNLPDVVVGEEMVDTGEQISLDYLRNPALDSDQDEEEEVVNVVVGGGGDVGGDGAGAGNAPDQVPVQGENLVDGEVKKKKKKRKNKKRNMPMADDDLVEEPELDQALVDAEAAKIYKPAMSADERFRLAMENFRKERVFNAITSQILSTYFTFGGVDPNQVALLHTSNNDVEIEVDIIYVVSAFLSSYLISSSGWYDSEYFTTAPKLVIGFLRYLLLKRVIPEYDDDLRKAIEIAQRAKIEAPKCQKFNKSFPDSFNETCSILYVRDFEYDTLPDDSLERMEQVTGIRVATEVELRGKEIRRMRVVAVEPMDPDLHKGKAVESKDSDLPKGDGVESMDESLGTEQQQQQSNVVPYSRVSLAKLPIGWSGDTTTTTPATTTDTEEERVTIFVESELAGYLDIGTVVWGTFFTLSNGVVFARPLGAHPSFFVEQDETVNDD
ncbi:hypothetical protein EC957_002273 [Mortierella hygrophila]|uniref:Uncharacterized protein n=1 Tax=Mortierella hygrophila TaxID=979708 RepID=A0A9P6F5H7_9FUNG|nr:hypothetical protein EC957_002273 [Mortierella hygrophila]